MEVGASDNVWHFDPALEIVRHEGSTVSLAWFPHHHPGSHHIATAENPDQTIAIEHRQTPEIVLAEIKRLLTLMLTVVGQHLVVM